MHSLLVLASCLLPHTQALRHYGYYFGPNLNELDRVSDHSNVALVEPGGEVLLKTLSHPAGAPAIGNCTDIYDMCAIPHMAAEAVANLTDLAKVNMKAVLLVQTVFMADVKQLLPIHQQRWDLFWSLVSPHAANILTIYPEDEPPQTWPPTGSYAEMVAYIKQSTPAVPPLTAVLSGGRVKGIECSMNVSACAPPWPYMKERGPYELPPEIDWIGFDQYNCWDKASWLGASEQEFACWDNRTVPHDLEVVDRYVQKRGGKMIVIPDALSGWNQSFVGYKNASAQQTKLMWAKRYLAFCQANPRCVAMLPFLWKTVAGAAAKQQDACCWGLKDMPEVLLPGMKQIGAAIGPLA